MILRDDLMVLVDENDIQDNGEVIDEENSSKVRDDVFVSIEKDEFCRNNKRKQYKNMTKMVRLISKNFPLIKWSLGTTNGDHSEEINGNNPADDSAPLSPQSQVRRSECSFYCLKKSLFA